MKGNIATIIIAHKDRFVWDRIAQFLHKIGVEITVVHNEKLSPQKELVQDLLSIIHVCSRRVYGLRKYKECRRIKRYEKSIFYRDKTDK
jgi:putative resolvase